MTLSYLSFILVVLFAVICGLGDGILVVAAGSSAVANTTVTIDNEAPSITYNGNWIISRDQSYSDGSSSITTTPGAFFILLFNGSSINYYGASLANGAKFNVTLDGQHQGTCSTAITNTPSTNQSMLWSSEGLSANEEHVFQITHADTAGKHLSVDKLTYIATGLIPSSLTGQGTASPMPSSTPTLAASNSSKKKKTGAIVGGVFGVLIGISLILVLIWFWMKRRDTHARGVVAKHGALGNSGYVNMGAGLLGGLSAWKRGSGRSGATGTTAYDEDTKVAVPHLYNSYNSGTMGSHQMTSFKDSFGPTVQNSLFSTGPAVPFQIPLSTDSQSPTRTHSRSLSQNKALPAVPHTSSSNSPSREVDFTSPVTGEKVYSHPYSSSYASGGGVTSAPSAAFTSTTGGYHPYAPYAQDYARPSIFGSVGSRAGSLDLKRGSSAFGSTSSLKLERGTELSRAYSEDHRGDLSLSRTISAGSGTSMRNDALSLGGAMSQQRGQPIAQAPKSSMYPTTSHNNSTNSLSFYPDATSADGLARSYQPTVMARPESRASSVSSKRFSNQLFTR